ncbi:MAG: FHA domain-containing protein [Clostridia bacterium]|nr:FHA domain-containing protein [Clostridia bacterium]
MVIILVIGILIIAGLIGYIVFLRCGDFVHIKKVDKREMDAAVFEDEMDDTEAESADGWEHCWDWKISTQKAGSPKWVKWGVVQPVNRGILQTVQLHIGRDAHKNDIVLHDKSVSRVHARLVFDDSHDKWLFVNLTKNAQTVYLGEGEENHPMKTKDRVEMLEEKSYFFLLGETYICFEALEEESTG